MSIEEINKDFIKNKNTQKKLQVLNSKIEKLNIDIDSYKFNIQHFEIDKEKAIKSKDKVAEASAKAAIEGEKSKIKAAEAQLNKMKAVIEKNHQKVEEAIEKVSEDPELKKHVDVAMKKRIVRRSQKALKENKTLEGLEGLMNKHPSIKNNIVGMKNAQIEIKKLKEDLKTLDKKRDAAKIAKIEADIKTLKSKYDKNEQLVMNCANKENVDISKESLKGFIADNSFKTDKTGNWKIEETIKNKIKGNEKTIENDQAALSKLTGKDIKFELGQDDNMKILTKENLPAVKENLKWYQFGKRIRNWIQNKMNAYEEPDVFEDTKEFEEVLEDSASNKFKSAYKFDVVKEYAKKTEKDLYKQVKKERKAATNTREEQEEEEVEL